MPVCQFAVPRITQKIVHNFQMWILEFFHKDTSTLRAIKLFVYQVMGNQHFPYILKVNFVLQKRASGEKNCYLVERL